jgi:rubrerythrin
MSEQESLTVTEVSILNTCCEIEETAAQLYWYLATLYEDNVQLREAWEKTAREEEEHAAQFRLASRLRGSGMRVLKADYYKVKNVLAKMQAIYAGVQKSPPSLNDALRFAISLERALAEYHVGALVTFHDKELARLFISMKQNDESHIERFEQVAQRFTTT